MTTDVGLLCATAASIGTVHTLLGPDHYVPFIAMARVGQWTLRKTVVVTLLCGAAHVLSSVVLGAVGILAGTALFRLERIESVRGQVAGWLLLAFGLVYFAWGLRAAARNRPHTHLHVHDDGTLHRHMHVHVDDHAHLHAPPLAPASDARAESLTPWVLFTVFVFGPCEPLIPLLMVPAAQGSPADVALVTAVFGATTLLTMTAVVAAATAGWSRWSVGGLHRYGHAAAGLALLACGAAVVGGL